MYLSSAGIKHQKTTLVRNIIFHQKFNGTHTPFDKFKKQKIIFTRSLFFFFLFNQKIDNNIIMERSNNVIHGPAQKVGNMRVSRKPVKRYVVNTATGDHSKVQGHQTSGTGEQQEGPSATTSESNDTEHRDSFDVYTGGDDNDSGNNEQHDGEEENKVYHSGERGLDRWHNRGLQDRTLYDLQAHIASREPAVSANPGSNVKQIYHSNAQPRGTSH